MFPWSSAYCFLSTVEGSHPFKVESFILGLNWLNTQVKDMQWISSDQLGSKGGSVVRALASHQCGLGSNPGVDTICVLSLLLVLSLVPRGFSPGTPVFPSPPNCNSTRNQVDEEPLCGCATSKSLFIYLFIHSKLFIFCFRLCVVLFTKEGHQAKEKLVLRLLAKDKEYQRDHRVQFLYLYEDVQKEVIQELNEGLKDDRCTDNSTAAKVNVLFSFSYAGWSWITFTNHD